MSILRLFFELFVIYILYKFIFEFIIPVYNTSRQVKQKMDAMQQQMRQQQQQQQQQASNNQYNRSEAAASPKKPAHEDYIDYEEIK
jgi:predicted Holliday junction resolvase-like endonuclease